MAGDRRNNGAENDVVDDDLEAMRKGSSSWHPCHVSLCSRGLGLVVEYGDDRTEEVIADKEEVLARIRVRSTPLQGDDCASLREGDRVLATQSSQVKGVFYDARIEKAIRVRHSKRIHCRCSFTINWLHQPVKEEVSTVPSSAIMKLSTKSINLHPTISTFFRKLESSNSEDTLMFSKTVDSMSWEMDINVLLEKQIEEISNSTNVSHKKISTNIVFGLAVDVNGQNQDRVVDASFKDPHITIPFLNSFKGITESDNKQPMETTVESPPASVPSIQDEFNGSRLPLNPLAARAALASLRSKFPQSEELLIQSNVEKRDITSEHGSAKLPRGRKCSSFSAVDHSSKSDDFSLKVSAAFGGRSPNLKSIAKTLFPTTPSSPPIVEFSKVCPTAQVKGTKKKDNISENKITQPSEMRLTRARIQKNNGMHESISPQNCLPDNQKLVASPIDCVTSTDSDKRLLGKNKVIVKDDSEKRTSAKDAEKRNYPKRRTRSAAGEESEKNNVQPKIKARKSNFFESNESEENASTERNKVKITTKTAETVTGSSRGTRSKSAASSNKQETRFSHRLKFLARTRSQTKS